MKGLQCPTERVSCPVMGIGSTYVSKRAILKFFSLQSRTTEKQQFLVIENLPIILPPVELNQDIKNSISSFPLADPHCFSENPVHIILGANLPWRILRPGRMLFKNGQILLQETTYGWIIVNFNDDTNSLQDQSKYEISAFAKTEELNFDLEKFWKIEECSVSNTDEKHVCEALFIETTYLNFDNYFVVQLPFMEDPRVLGDTRRLALKRLFLLERKLQKNEKLRTMYTEFMREYELLGHMTEVQFEENSDEPSYYIPHLGVLRENSLTTKLRVVFDASAKSSSNKSLNDILHAGPTIQSTLFDILLRFREYPIVVTGDVTKMYRMILVAPEHRKFQRILWRESSTGPIKTYELNTVTYGTSPAPFLAIRSLCEAANQHEATLPLGASHVKKSFYVDDFLGGGKDREEARKVKEEVEKITSSRHFNLRKFASNDPEVLKTDSAHSEPLYFNDSEDIKVLGLEWHPKTDNFCFTSKDCKVEIGLVTKRIILSETSKLFDPLGLVSPIVIRAKMLMQELWQLKLSWDEPVSERLRQEWIQLKNDITILENITVPRHINVSPRTKKLIYHGFSDASKKAYGACIFAVCVEDGLTTSTLLCSKSRVAPMKTLTIPRLELSAALLLTRLMKMVLAAVNNHPQEINLWSDSTDVLYWLQKPACNWQTFVANRVSEIQKFTSEVNAVWRYVPSKDNPADLISRGTSAKGLQNCELWKSGPSWLTLEKEFWPIHPQAHLSASVNEEKIVRAFIGLPSLSLNSLLDRISSLPKLLRIVGYALRFIHNAKQKEQRITTKVLQPEELEKALKVCVKSAQRQFFSEEINTLMLPNGALKGSSRLKTLNPLIDSEGLLRVGGRLENSNLTENEKHPMLLPPHHKLTHLIIIEEHKAMHAAPLALLANIRLKFWPLQGRRLTTRVVNRCVECIRAKPKFSTPLMGPLPAERVVAAPAFTSVGIDFTGPIRLKSSTKVATLNRKAYITVFVCYVTKAVHLDISADLSTETFINTFKRFISRRGMPHVIFSDNAKTFVAADKYVQKCFDRILQDPILLNFLSTKRIKWKFSPPYSPHFGGLFEAAIKSFKFHFRRVVANHSLTIEEAQTVVVQIESVLNSRPMTPLSSDPNDLTALTPGHFIIGRPFTALPGDVPIQSYPASRRDLLIHYKQVNTVQIAFWKRWSTEYLQSLQTFPKWYKKTQGIKQGSLVIVRDKLSLPMCWPLARVVKLHPGKDGISRVATLRTRGGLIIRATTELSAFPDFEETSRGENVE